MGAQGTSPPAALVRVSRPSFFKMTKVKAYELRTKTSKELIAELEEQKAELAQLRVAQVTGGAASKLMKIKVVRKNIARVLTVYNMKQKTEAAAKYKGKKWVPKDLRPKMTVKLRRKLKPEQEKAMTAKEKVKKQNFPKRKYAIKA